MYFQENPWLKSEFNNEGFPKILPKIPPKFLSKKEVIPINTIDVEIMFKTYDNKSRFIEFLLSKFSEKDVEKTKIEYCLGGDKNGRVIFWQIDEMLRLRTGKMMNYNALSGKRLKVRQGSLPSLSWVHAELKRVGKLDKNWTLTQCLFGLHLTSIYKDKPVHIVESENCSNHVDNPPTLSLASNRGVV